MQKWEYKTVRPYHQEQMQDSALNELAASGWELVTVVFGKPSGYSYIFKRLKS